jgi:hypothetical protein
MYGAKILLVIFSLFMPIPVDHDDYECMSHDYCDYEDDDGESYCFLGCDNIIIIPGLPGGENGKN